MKNNTRALVEGAIFTAIYAVITIASFYLPVIGGFITFLIPIPIVIYFAKNNNKNGVTFMFATAVIALLIQPGLGAINIILWNFAGFTYGYLLKKGVEAKYRNIILVIVYFIDFTLTYYFIGALIGVDPIHELQVSLLELNKMIKNVNPQASKQILFMYDNLMYFLPLIVFAASIMNTIITHVFSVEILKRLRIPVDTMKPYIYWRFPKQFLYGFVVYTVILLLFQKQLLPYLAITQVIGLVFNFVFIINGFFVVAYYVVKKKLPSLYRILAMLFVFTSIGSLFYLILGVMDLSGDLRARIQ